MKTVAQVSDSWYQYAAFTSLSALKDAIWAAETSLSYVDELRSICWKIFLLFQGPLKEDTCLPVLRDSRSAYASLRSHFLKAIDHPGSIDETGADPLSEDEQSLWNALREDEIVREEIWRDVERCMPDNEYFRDPRIQKLLLDVLFVWCKLNPDVGYRQGMHEVLAPLVWVLDADAVNVEEARDAAEVVIAEMLDSRYVEHDAFTLFARIMQTAKSFYEPADEKSSGGEAPMITIAKHIFNDLLPAVDAELALHLRRLDILPQIFLMRWVRLLFGREFKYQEVLEIWDLLLSEGAGLQLVDYVCVAMILRVRWELLDADTNAALTLLLRYPPLKDSSPRSLVHDARQIRSFPKIETGSALILEHTGRQPAIVEPEPRPSTPSRARSSRATVSSPASLEVLLQDAARGVLSRGERWGLNQAVRDVVGEVRKGVRGIQETGSPASSRTHSPRPIQHRPRGSRGGSETHGAIAANVLRKMNALEERNRRLADMLEGAVKELWGCHEELVERRKKQDSTDEQERRFVERISRSTAQVQLVQGILRDMSLPLPEEHMTEASAGEPRGRISAPADETDTSANVASEAESATPRASSQSPDELEATQSDATAMPIRSQASPRSQSAMPAKAANAPPAILLSSPAYSTPPPLPPSPTPDPLLARPRLTSSSFSWMLADNVTEEPPFARATPFAPNERRSHARSGKAFLFGDIDEEDSIGDHARKTSPARRGSKVKGKAAPSSALSFESIGLGDVRPDEKQVGGGDKGEALASREAPL